MIRRAMVNPGVIVVVAILATSAIGMSWAINAYGLALSKKPIYPPGNRRVSAVPAETAHWIRVGSDRLESSEVVAELGTENYLNRSYTRKDPVDTENQSYVELHLAYYTGQIDTVPHVPERCFVGGGLAIGSGSKTLPLVLDSTGWIQESELPDDVQGPVYRARLANIWSDRPGSRVRLPGDPSNLYMRITEFLNPNGTPFYSGYFFIANGKTLASAEDVRLLAFDLTDDYAFYLKVQVTSRTAKSAQELADLTSSLLDDLYPEVARCIPDWIEVTAGRYPVADNTDQDQT